MGCSLGAPTPWTNTCPIGNAPLPVWMGKVYTGAGQVVGRRQLCQFDVLWHVQQVCQGPQRCHCTLYTACPIAWVEYLRVDFRVTPTTTHCPPWTRARTRCIRSVRLTTRYSLVTLNVTGNPPNTFPHVILHMLATHSVTVLPMSQYTQPNQLLGCAFEANPYPVLRGKTVCPQLCIQFHVTLHD